MNEMTQYVKDINSPQIHPYSQYHLILKVTWQYYPGIAIQG